MAYAHKNLRVTFGGKIYGDQDIWSNTIHVGYTDKDWEYNSVDTVSETNQGIIEAIQQWFISADANISQYATLSWVKFAIIDTDGKYAKNGNEYEFNETYDFPAVTGGNSYSQGGSQVAPQLSVAITFLTDVARGAGRFGRIYPPLTGTASNIGLDSFQQERLTAAVKLIDDINGELNSFFPSTDPAVIVASAAGAGINAKVRRVRVGQVIDTQRRRRNAIPENYAGRDVATFQVG